MGTLARPVFDRMDGQECSSYIVKAEGIVFLRGFRSHARQSVGESQEHPRSGERGYVWLRLRRASWLLHSH